MSIPPGLHGTFVVGDPNDTPADGDVLAYDEAKDLYTAGTLSLAGMRDDISLLQQAVTDLPVGGLEATGVDQGFVPTAQGDDTWTWAAQTGTGGTGVTDHGALTGLGDDDHPQYALADGTRGSFAATDHSHAISGVTGLQDALDGKAASSHDHDDRYYTEGEVDAALAGKAPASHTHGAADLSGVVKTVNGTAPDGAGNVVVAGGGGAIPDYSPASTAPRPGAPWVPFQPGGSQPRWVRTPNAGIVAAAALSLHRALTIDGLAINVVAAGAGEWVRVGIYSDASGQPGTLLADTGQIDSSSTGIKQVVIAATTLPAGNYWSVAMASSNTVKTIGWRNAGHGSSTPFPTHNDSVQHWTAGLTWQTDLSSRAFVQSEVSDTDRGVPALMLKAVV